jgi:hypothetical protein
MKKEHNSVEVVKEYCGRYNTDIHAGWSAGLMGMVRVGKKLSRRQPSEHLFNEDKNKQRLIDWWYGRDKAMEYKAKQIRQEVGFFAEDKLGKSVTVFRKGWSVNRGTVVNRLARKGCVGDVTVNYYENDILVRTVVCGI